MMMTYQFMSTALKAKKVRHLRTTKPRLPTTTSSMAGTEPGEGTMTIQLKTKKKFGQRHLLGQTCLSIWRYLDQKLFLTEPKLNLILLICYSFEFVCVDCK